MTLTQQTCKRAFDGVIAVFGLLLVWPIILIAIVLVRSTTGEPGLFSQVRVGRQGKLFRIFKIRTMTSRTANQSTVTIAGDPRISKIGRFLRRTKIDELPQLWNVLIGDMSIVGPRPDVPEMFERCVGVEHEALVVRPGITGPASLKYRDEELLLRSFMDPVILDRQVFFPDKLKINARYVAEYSFVKDLYFLACTVMGAGERATLRDLEELVREHEVLSRAGAIYEPGRVAS